MAIKYKKGRVLAYIVDPGSGLAEDSPYIIIPDDEGGDKRLLLCELLARGLIVSVPAGDPFVKFAVANVDKFVVGYDTSADRFKISASEMLGKNDVLIIDSSGNMSGLGTLTSAAGTLTIGETANTTSYHTDARAATWLAAGHETTYNHTNYDTAFGWGDHAGLYDPAGTMTTHEAAADPHTQYAKESIVGTSIGTGLLLDGAVLKASAILQKYHAIDPSADVQSLLGCANEAAIRTLLDLEAGTDFYSKAAEDTWRSNVSQTEMSYLDGTSSDIQTQFNTKAPIDAPTFTTSVTIPQTAGVADYDKFLVSDGGVIKYRTGAQVASDIGAGGDPDAMIKAWVHFDAATNGPIIRDSFNVASITDGGVGRFTVVWDTDFANTYYVTSGMAWLAGGFRHMTRYDPALAVGSARIDCVTPPSTRIDPTEAMVMAIGDQ